MNGILGHESPHRRLSGGQDRATSPKALDQFGIVHGAFPEVAFAHAGQRQVGFNIGQKRADGGCLFVCHGAHNIRDSGQVKWSLSHTCEGSPDGP